MFTDPFSSLSTYDKLATIALYVTIALVIAIAGTAIILKKKKPKSLKIFRTIVFGIAIGYSLAMIVIMMSFRLIDYKEQGYLENLFSIKTSEFAISSPAQLYIYAILLPSIMTCLAIFFGKKLDRSENTKSIVYAATCIAMSFALSYIRFLELPQGGSITFVSLLPLMVYAYMYGTRKGVLAGVIYGILQFLQAPWFFHPIQFLLDYPIAFMSIGLTGLFSDLGLFRNKKYLQFALGGLVAVIFRYFSHVVSGIFVFGSADPDNYGAVAWSFLYNSFVFADMAISLGVAVILFANKGFTKLLEPINVKALTKNNAPTIEQGLDNKADDGEVRTVALVLNGPELDIEITEEDIICADGGYNKITDSSNVLAIVGDMDSIEKIPEDIKTLLLPREKDCSDGECAIRYIKELGKYSKVNIYAGFGGRPDHVVSNLGLLEYANDIGIDAVMKGKGVTVSYTDKNVEIDASIGDTISIMPLKMPLLLDNGKGVKYPINDLKIETLSSIGLSNIATEEKVSVEIKSGSAFIFHFDSDYEI
ncbi:MAG TPA: energy-coupled thiamine transporter ThiT [Clostridia bacterium]|nr:energy-coupled thiamine transporter ThiT [Clostridia bacterium]